jgi:hypothetical protein
MVAAGFTEIFVGIETPSVAALESAGKSQNLRLDVGEAVARLTAAGLEVFAGFIIGFDADGEDIFDRQIELISRLPVPRAMVGLLMALPGTALWRRLERENRLRRVATGDQFTRPNFETTLPEPTLLVGYRRVLSTVYSDEAYYARCEQHLRQVRLPATGHLRPGWARPLLRAIWEIGLKGPRRALFWRLLARGFLRGRAGFSKAVVLAILGEHHLRYTHEVVLPRIDRSLEALFEEASQGSGSDERTSDAHREAHVVRVTAPKPPRRPAPALRAPSRRAAHPWRA